MCKKISFNQDKKGNIYDAGGLSYSHSEISELHKMDDDITNKYEFNPEDGLKTDKEIFTPKSSHIRMVESYIKPFKNKKYFEKYGSNSDNMDWSSIDKILPNAQNFKRYLKRIESIKWLSAKHKKLPINILNLMKEYSQLIDKKDRKIVTLSVKRWSTAESVAVLAAELVARSAARSAAESAAGLAARSAARSVLRSATRSAAGLAARSAARSAAESAVWLAAESAVELAARSAAGLAARSAAESAVWLAAESAVELAARSAAESVLRSATRSAAWILFPERLKNRNNIFEYYLKVAEAGYLIYKVSDDTIYLLRK